jgi:hypothetical protein
MTNDPLKVPTGSDLIARLKAGDVSAFEAIYLRYCQRTFEYFSSKVDASQDVERLVVEVFVSVWHDRLRLNDTDLEQQILQKTRTALIKYVVLTPESELYAHLLQKLIKE